jgi:hypothetical protein
LIEATRGRRPSDRQSRPVPDKVGRVTSTAAEMMGWITEIVGFGVRRPGWPADDETSAWILAAFQRLGLVDAHLEALEVPVWESDHARLTAWAADDPSRLERFDGFALPHTQPVDGLEASLVRFDGASETARGAIAVEQIALTRLPQAFPLASAHAWHDPDGDLADHVQVLPFSSRLQEVAEPAMAAGAVGFVGVLSGAPWDTHDYYVPYDGIERPISGLWLSRSEGARLDALLEAGDVRGRLDIDGRRPPRITHNVIGTLPGRGDEWVIVGSHHDAPWASAVEDGTGIALVLAQAAYWAAIPVEERPHNMLFVLMAGHMVHGAGTRAFIEAHADLLARTVLEIHLEHAAAEVESDGAGGLVPTGRPEPQWWFTHKDPELQRSVASALAAEDVRRSMVLDPETFGPRPPTDGGFFHVEGVPIVNFLAAPMYLFDSADTLDKVHQASLEPITRATIRIVQDLAGRSAADLRG